MKYTLLDFVKDKVSITGFGNIVVIVNNSWNIIQTVNEECGVSIHKAKDIKFALLGLS